MTSGQEVRGRVGVIGAGSWGTALAALLARKGRPTVLWARETEVVESVRESGVNRLFLPDIELPRDLEVTDNLPGALDGAEFLVFVTPAQHTASVLEAAVDAIPGSATLITASKGIEINTLRRMDQVFAEVLGPGAADSLAVLSGPSFAQEVAQSAPTAVAVASSDPQVRTRVQSLFQTDTFRCYTTDDVIGLEIGGALKNVIALAAGIAAGLGFGHNTRAALITRGLAEIRRLGVAVGARSETFAGLAGMGDLVLTCTGELSRNRTAGVRIGRGEPVEAVLAGGRSVAEGVPTADAAHRLAAQIGVEMPICAEVHAILEGRSSPEQALRNLMSRDPKPEEWG